MMKFQSNLKHRSVLLLLSFILSFSLLCSSASAGMTTGDDDGRRRRRRQRSSSSSSSRRLHGPDLVDAHRRFEDRTRSAFELIRSKKQQQYNNTTTAASAAAAAAATGHTNTDDDEGGNGDDIGDSTNTGSTHNRYLEPVTSTTTRQQKAKSSKKTTRKPTTKNDNDNDDDVCKIELGSIEKELAMTEQDLANTRMDLQDSNEELNECQDKLDEESGSTQLYVQMAKSCMVYREKNEEGEDDGSSNKYTYYLSTSQMAKETWQFADRPLRTETTINTNYFVHAFSEMYFTEETGGSPNAAFTFVNLDEDEFEGPLVSIIIKAASVVNNAASNNSLSEDVYCDIDDDGDSDHHFTNCNTYTYELEQSEDQSGILSFESFFGHDYQVDNPDLVEYDDCSIFIDSFRISEPNAVPLESPCCNCVSFNNNECIEYGEICVDCTTIVTEAEGFSANIYWPLTTVQEPLPVISWGHGLSNDGHRLDAARRNLFVFFAKLGFVVVAHRLDHGWPSKNQEFQLKALDVLYESDEFTSLVDPNGITVLAGYSMGGAGTLNNANKRDIIDKYNIKAAIAFHPWIPERYVEKQKRGCDKIKTYTVIESFPIIQECLVQ